MKARCVDNDIRKVRGLPFMYVCASRIREKRETVIDGERVIRLLCMGGMNDLDLCEPNKSPVAVINVSKISKVIDEVFRILSDALLNIGYVTRVAYRPDTIPSLSITYKHVDEGERMIEVHITPMLLSRAVRVFEMAGAQWDVHRLTRTMPLVAGWVLTYVALTNLLVIPGDIVFEISS